MSGGFGVGRSGDSRPEDSPLGRALPVLVFAAALVGIWLGMAIFAAIS